MLVFLLALVHNKLKQILRNLLVGEQSYRQYFQELQGNRVLAFFENLECLDKDEDARV